MIKLSATDLETVEEIKERFKLHHKKYAFEKKMILILNVQIC